MKKDFILFAAVAFIVILLFVKRKEVKKVMEKLSRGYRNNNPGNIVLTYKDGKKYFWNGEIEGKDSRFKVFKSMPYGYRAIFVTLNSYISKGFDTIEKIINRYAPPSENQTSSYVKHVAGRSGIDKDKVVSFSNPDEIKKIVEQISYVENGIKPNIEDIEIGYKLFAS